MAPRRTTEEVYEAVLVSQEKLSSIDAHLARMNGSIAELQRAGGNRETRLVVLEHNDKREQEELETLQECVQDMKLSQAKSVGIGGAVGAIVSQLLPRLIDMLTRQVAP